MKRDDVDLLQIMTAGARLADEPSHALERHKYGDPANFVKFENEQLGTKEIEGIIRHELDNWIRWGRKRDWMPVGFRSQLGNMYKTPHVLDGSQIKPIPCNELSAADFERIVIGLPKRHREAFVMHHLTRARHEVCARALGVQVRQYHYIVNQAHSIVLRGVRKLTK